jgi:hypothetical protein
MSGKCFGPNNSAGANVILPVQTEIQMTQDTVRIIALVLLLVVIALIFLRRKSKKKTEEDDF